MPITLRYCTCPICGHRFRIKVNPTFIEELQQNLYYAHCDNCGRDLQVLESYTETEEYNDSILYGDSFNTASCPDLTSISLYDTNDLSSVITNAGTGSIQLNSISASTYSDVATRDEVEYISRRTIVELLQKIKTALGSTQVKDPENFQELNTIQKILQSVADSYGITL